MTAPTNDRAAPPGDEFDPDQYRMTIGEHLDELRRRLILGGGSNVLFTADFDGAVLCNRIGGIEVVAEDADHVYLRAGAGVVWDDFVNHCIERGLGGVENLVLIPGSVGASPMQNIGAYGVEVRDVFHSLDAVHLEDGAIRTFAATECAFGYRESVFKRACRDQYAILAVTFRLSRRPRFVTEYAPVRQELERMKVETLTPRVVARAVVNVRTSKLPDPKVVGNAGSFFKNPTIPAARFEALRRAHAEIPGFAMEDGRMKVPAGWLIERCGWKGFREGDAGCYPKQALVLVNYGRARGREILALADRIAASVRERFGIDLEREVNII